MAMCLLVERKKIIIEGIINDGKIRCEHQNLVEILSADSTSKFGHLNTMAISIFDFEYLRKTASLAA